MLAETILEKGVRLDKYISDKNPDYSSWTAFYADEFDSSSYRFGAPHLSYEVSTGYMSISPGLDNLGEISNRKLDWGFSSPRVINLHQAVVALLSEHGVELPTGEILFPESERVVDEVMNSGNRVFVRGLDGCRNQPLLLVSYTNLDSMTDYSNIITNNPDNQDRLVSVMSWGSCAINKEGTTSLHSYGDSAVLRYRHFSPDLEHIARTLLVQKATSHLNVGPNYPQIYRISQGQAKEILEETKESREQEFQRWLKSL